MTMADRQPFVMLSILLYVTQTVPNGKLTQGKCGIGIGMVIAVTLLFESLLIVELLPGRQVLLGLALNQHSLVTGDGLAALRLCCVSADANVRAWKWHTLRYSSLASCHSFVMVRGRMGLANMRVKAKTAKAPMMTAEERRKTLRPSSGGGGRRGPWGPKAM